MTLAELITAFAALAPAFSNATPATIGRALDVPFDLTSQTEWAEVWQAPGTSPVTDWELRLPRPGAAFGPLLIAELVAPGIDAAELDPLLADWPVEDIDVVSPPLDGGADWVPLHSSCHTLPEASLCVTWQGFDPAQAIALSLEAHAEAE
ncbi:MAG: hypothetical protein P8X66_05420 [Maritimibacter sp.]